MAARSGWIGTMLGPRDLAGSDAVPKKWRTTPYKAVRRVWCTSCCQRYRVSVSKHSRLRFRRSPCCGARLRAWTSGAALFDAAQDARLRVPEGDRFQFASITLKG